MLNETWLAVKPIKLIKGPAHGISYIARLRKQWKHNCLEEMCLFLCFVSALTGAGKSFTFGLARIFRTMVSFLSAQFRQFNSIQGLPNVILDTSCKSRHSSFFGAKRKWKPFKRDKSTSCDFVARSAALRPNHILRWNSWGRLVASLM